jgi:ADP-ribosyl-[dinitrogen reductase] hydrolase
MRERRSVLTDRVAGAVLGAAVGDALGAGYEFGSAPLPPDGCARMVGGGLGGFAPGEWTDDTAMTTAILEVAATGRLDLDAIGQRFLDWFRGGPADVGNATRAVLGRAREAADLPAAAVAHLAAHPRGGAGNGALMRTGPVALVHLGDDAALAGAAREVAALTHADPLAGDACVLWCVAIDRAVRQRRLDGVREGLALLPVDRRERWAGWLDDAEHHPPASFTPNGFTVTALQAAYAAVVQTPVPAERPGLHLQHALHAAIAIGDDTDTVASIAGALVGARWGASAVPWVWRRPLHGWPGLRSGDLVRLAVLAAAGGEPDEIGWPSAEVLPARGAHSVVVSLPGDPDLLLGSLARLPTVVDEVDAVLSLCRVGRAQVPAGVEHHELLLIDGEAPDDNPNLDLVLDDAVTTLRTWRSEGKRVFVHCQAGATRTPTVAAAYLAERDGIDGATALARIAAALEGRHQDHNATFRAALARR